MLVLDSNWKYNRSSSGNTIDDVQKANEGFNKRCSSYILGECVVYIFGQSYGQHVLKR